MGLDIGFTLYEKKPLDEEGKLVAVKLSNIKVGLWRRVLFFLKHGKRYKADEYENWRCGWGKPNESWGSLFEFNDLEYVTPVFQEGIVKHPQILEEFKETYKLVDFDLFADYVHEACTDAYVEADEERAKLLDNQRECQETIKELRNLQRGCTEDNQYAFDRWEEKISTCRNRIENSKKLLQENDFADENQAKSVNALLDSMEKYLKEDRYYVIPYFSC